MKRFTSAAAVLGLATVLMTTAAYADVQRPDAVQAPRADRLDEIQAPRGDRLDEIQAPRG